MSRVFAVHCSSHTYAPHATTIDEHHVHLARHFLSATTAVLHQLHLGEAKETVPTVNYDVQTITHRKLKMHVWDVGGQDSLRPFWRHYLTGTQGILYVVDSSDSGRLELARKELQALLVDAQLDGVPLVVLANKQDADGAQSPEGVTKALDLAT